MTVSLDLTADGARDAFRARTTEKPSLIGLTRAELAEALVGAGIVPPCLKERGSRALMSVIAVVELAADDEDALAI